MAGVWIRELQPYGRGLEQRASAIWPGFGSENFSHMAGVWMKLDWIDI